MIFKAIEFAAKAHNGQFRKCSQIPYIIHPIHVAKILIENGFAEPVVAAGILHDTVEDTIVTLEDIKREFGNEVAQIVTGASEPDRSKQWEERKKHTIEFLKTANEDIIAVVCADKIDNAGSILEDLEKEGQSIWKRFNRPKKDQQWYYGSIVEVLESRETSKQIKTLVEVLKSEVEKVFVYQEI